MLYKIHHKTFKMKFKAKARQGYTSKSDRGIVLIPLCDPSGDSTYYTVIYGGSSDIIVSAGKLSVVLFILGFVVRRRSAIHRCIMV